MKCQRCGKESDMGHGDISPCEPSVSKPWEQEWTVPVTNQWVVRDAEARVDRVHAYNDDQSKEESDAVVTFIAAAPDMARALKALADAVEAYRGEHGPSHALDSALGDAYDAMTKGGMPL